MVELIKTVEVNKLIKYEIYSYGSYYIVVDYFNNEVNGESIPLEDYELEEYINILVKIDRNK